MGTDDRQVDPFLKQFTLLPLDEIAGVVAAHEAEPGRRLAQRRLAHEATALVHGRDEADTAVRVSELLFGADPTEATAPQLAGVGREVPNLTLDRAELEAGIDVADVLARDQFLVASKGEARRALAQGGVYVNGQRADEARRLTSTDLLHGRYVVVRKGKKAYGLVDAS
jgi:tyrosyl-tRNA synthetase